MGAAGSHRARDLTKRKIDFSPSLRVVFQYFSDQLAGTKIGEVELLSELRTIWDANQGRKLPAEYQCGPADVDILDDLCAQLRTLKLRLSTRKSYNRWCKVWLSFCEVNRAHPMPASRQWLARFMTYLAVHYSISTVNIAVAALAALHGWNGFDNPIKNDTVLQDLLKSIAKSGLAGVKAKKFVVDESFVFRMCTYFIDDYPCFDAEVFDPWRAAATDADRSVMWLRGLCMILVGLELGLRCSEVCNLTACCWEVLPDKDVFVPVKGAKNGQVTRDSGSTLVWAEGQFCENFSAISLMEEYWFPFMSAHNFGVSAACTHKAFPRAACVACSPLFPAFKKHLQKVGPLSKSEVTSVVKKWATRIGRDPKLYSAISFRRGSVSMAAAEKVDREVRQHHLRWRSTGMQDGYTERSKADRRAVGEAIRQRLLRYAASRQRRVDFSV